MTEEARQAKRDVHLEDGRHENTVPQTILVVEDDPVLLHVISSILEGEGHRVLETSDGLAALSVLQESSPHLILSDVMMPGLDGFALYRQVRANPIWSQIPFIFLTGKDHRNDIRHGMELGADDYLTKPFELEELLAAVKVRLERATENQVAISTATTELREAIIRTLSRELLTPLALAMGYGELLQESFRDMSDDEFQVSLSAHRSGSERLMLFVENCLPPSELESCATADLLYSPQETAEPDEHVAHIIDALESQAVDMNVSLILKQGAPGATIVVNRRSFTEIISRLVDNYIKYSKEQSGQAVLTTRQDGGFWVLDVVDDGAGISAEALQLVFDAFRQVDRDRVEKQGCGLGLAIVRELAEMCGGHVAVKSEPGKGSRFTVWLPLAAG
ncbi:response regulator [Chloroflexota bacterium]